MRIVEVLAVVLGLTLGSVGGWVHRQGWGIMPFHAQQIAVTWVQKQIDSGEVKAVETRRFAGLPGESWPADEPVYGVSLSLAASKGAPATLCLGVVVAARTGQVYGMVGEADWVRCS